MQKNSNKTAIFAVFIAFIALFFTSVGIVVGYKHWVRISDKAKIALAKVEILEAQAQQFADRKGIDDLTDKLSTNYLTQKESTNKTLQSLRSIQSNVSHNARQVEQQIKHITQWQQSLKNTSPHYSQVTDTLLLAEIQFLLDSAQIQLQLASNPKLALTLLQQIDRKLISLGEERYLPVRKAIAQHIIRLESNTYISIEALAEHISYLENASQSSLKKADLEHSQGTKVPLFDIEDEKLSSEHTNPNQSDLSWINGIKHYINDSITIYRRENAVDAGLSPIEKKHVHETFILYLAALRWSLYQRHSEQYQHLVTQIDLISNQYYTKYRNANWDIRINQLKQANIASSPLDLSDTITLFESIRIKPENTPDSSPKPSK